MPPIDSLFLTFLFDVFGDLSTCSRTVSVPVSDCCCQLHHFPPNLLFFSAPCRLNFPILCLADGCRKIWPPHCDCALSLFSSTPLGPLLVHLHLFEHLTTEVPQDTFSCFSSFSCTRLLAVIVTLPPIRVMGAEDHRICRRMHGFARLLGFRKVSGRAIMMFLHRGCACFVCLWCRDGRRRKRALRSRSLHSCWAPACQTHTPFPLYFLFLLSTPGGLARATCQIITKCPIGAGLWAGLWAGKAKRKKRLWKRSSKKWSHSHDRWSNFHGRIVFPYHLRSVSSCLGGERMRRGVDSQRRSD